MSLFKTLMVSRVWLKMLETFDSRPRLLVALRPDLWEYKGLLFLGESSILKTKL